MPRGFLVILSAPSGAGKSTICRRLLRERKDLRYSISCTTRPPRHGEKHGQHYFFVPRQEFKKKVRRGDFLEWAVVHGEYYGTPKGFVEKWVRRGRRVVLAIDVQGAAAIRRKRPDCVLIFIVPPSWKILKERLLRRRDSHESVKKRLSVARHEISHAKDYDYFVVNDRLDRAMGQVGTILKAESLRTSRLAYG